MNYMRLHCKFRNLVSGMLEPELRLRNEWGSAVRNVTYDYYRTKNIIKVNAIIFLKRILCR